jgi:hypothetical protein
MRCVLRTYVAPEGLTKAGSDELFAENAYRYVKVFGLIPKHFGYSEDGKGRRHLSLESRAAVDAFLHAAIDRPAGGVWHRRECPLWVR